MRLCGCDAEDLAWETCSSVDAGGSGEPEVDSPSSSSSELMVNAFGGSGTEIRSPCGTGRTADGILDTLLSTSFSSWCPRNRWQHTEVAVSCVITWLPPNYRNSKRQRMSFVIQPLRKIFCTFTAAYLRGPGFILVAHLASEIQMIGLFLLSRWWLFFALQTPLHRKCNKVICTINTVKRHH